MTIFPTHFFQDLAAGFASVGIVEWLKGLFSATSKKTAEELAVDQAKKYVEEKVYDRARIKMWAYMHELEDVLPDGPAASRNLLRRWRERQERRDRRYPNRITGLVEPYGGEDEDRFEKKMVEVWNDLGHSPDLRKKMFIYLGMLTDEEFDTELEMLRNDYVRRLWGSLLRVFGINDFGAWARTLWRNVNNLARVIIFTALAEIPLVFALRMEGYTYATSEILAIILIAILPLSLIFLLIVVDPLVIGFFLLFDEVEEKLRHVLGWWVFTNLMIVALPLWVAPSVAAVAGLAWIAAALLAKPGQSETAREWAVRIAIILGVAGPILMIVLALLRSDDPKRQTNINIMEMLRALPIPGYTVKYIPATPPPPAASRGASGGAAVNDGASFPDFGSGRSAEGYAEMQIGCGEGHNTELQSLYDNGVRRVRLTIEEKDCWTPIIMRPLRDRESHRYSSNFSQTPVDAAPVWIQWYSGTGGVAHEPFLGTPLTWSNPSELVTARRLKIPADGPDTLRVEIYL